MAASDIYETKQVSNQSRTRSPAVSQRRDEYLRATGGEAVPHPHRRHHGRHRRSSGWKVVVRNALLGLGVLALLTAGALWWLVNKR